MAIPGPAQPVASCVRRPVDLHLIANVGTPSPDSMARARAAQLTREMGAVSIARCNAISTTRHCNKLGRTSPPEGGSAQAT
eukprot:3193023-Pyramimonas_sp.AAC.1